MSIGGKNSSLSRLSAGSLFYTPLVGDQITVSVPFREPPRYNPKRRPASAVYLLRSGSILDFTSIPSSTSCMTLVSHQPLQPGSVRGGGMHPPSSVSSHALLQQCSGSTPPLPPSPSPSDRSNPPCFSSACSSLSEASSSNRGSEGSSDDPASIVTGTLLLSTTIFSTSPRARPKICIYWHNSGCFFLIALGFLLLFFYVF